MDIITEKQKRMLSIGGNKRFKEFMENYDLNTNPEKYKTKAAMFYKGVIKALTERTDYKEIVPEYEEGRKIVDENIRKAKASKSMGEWTYKVSTLVIFHRTTLNPLLS